jgi:hypothetical protein
MTSIHPRHAGAFWAGIRSSRHAGVLLAGIQRLSYIFPYQE